VKVLKSALIREINSGEDYDHHYRRKSRMELTRISAAVMGIEFSYAAETAFVSPTLLEIGVSQRHMTLIWCLSPLVGFFLTPIMGSLSDRCNSALGRRRPFIILLSVGVVLGLILVPNGKYLGKMLGDQYSHYEPDGPIGRSLTMDSDDSLEQAANFTSESADYLSSPTSAPTTHHSHPWGIFFTIIGTVLLDFDADACQSPSRAYLLDVTLPEDHAIGLSTFTIMAGLGGSLGYVMGALDWGRLATLFGGHIRLVFTLVLFIFLGCVGVTLTSFREIPLDVLTMPDSKRKSLGGEQQYNKVPAEDAGYGALEQPAAEDDLETGRSSSANPFRANKVQAGGQGKTEGKQHLTVTETSFSQASPVPVENWEEADGAATVASFKTYLWSIIYMPSSLRWLCLTNLFCWSSLVCYSLYFTDFVGQAVFEGNPTALPGSEGRRKYDEGVKFACWGMAGYSLSCSCYSFCLDKLVKRFRAKPVYIGGQLVYCLGMIAMALTRSKWGVLVFSWSAGIMYSTLFTMPYLLVAHYHETDSIQCEDSWFLKQIRALLRSIQEDKKSREAGEPEQLFYQDQVRGIGTDIAIVSCMVFLAQFILSLCMGSIVAKAGSTVAVVVVASILSFCGAISANFVTYMEL
jgi:solute carrier family 45 protein 1/2/4